MCSVSMIADHYRDHWAPQWPMLPMPQQIYPGMPIPTQPVGRLEFEMLKAEVENMKALLKRAKAYDEANNEPHCEVEDKMNFLRKVANLVGVDLDDVIGKGAPLEGEAGVLVTEKEPTP